MRGPAARPVLRGHTGEVSDVAYSPDGRRLVTGGMDETVRIWESASGSPIHVLPGHDSFVRAVAFNGDGTRIASASEDRTVRLWDAATGTPIGILRRARAALSWMSRSAPMAGGSPRRARMEP